jgi:hypothetical protein
VIDPKTMNGRVFHIDPVAGDDSNDGLAPSRPLRTYVGRKFTAGDRVLIPIATAIPWAR